MISGKQELHEVARLLDVIPTTRDEATKQAFLTEMERASVVHIGEKKFECCVIKCSCDKF